MTPKTIVGEAGKTIKQTPAPTTPIPQKEQIKMNLDERSKALKILEELKPINVGAWGKASALVEPTICDEVTTLEEQSRLNPTDYALQEELEKYRDDAIKTAEYYLVEEDPERVEIFKDLRSKGWRVQEYWPTGEKGTDGVMYVSPRLGNRTTDIDPESIQYDRRIEDQENRLEYIARLHGVEQVMHGHPHGANIVKNIAGEWCMLDSKRCERKQVDWDDPASIFEAFRKDFMMCGRELYSARINASDLPQMADCMVEQYPISSPQIKQETRDLIQSEFEGQYTYRELGTKLSQLLREDDRISEYRESLRVLYKLQGASGDKLISSPLLADVMNAMIHGGEAEDRPSTDELKEIFRSIGIDEEKATPELDGAWSLLKEKVSELGRNELESVKVLGDSDYIRGVISYGILYGTFKPPQTK